MAVKKGDVIPGFSLQNTEGKDVSLTSLVIHEKLLLLFFPLAFSSVCIEELCKVRDNKKLYDALHTNIAAISTDSIFTLKEFKKANNLNFTLLSDFNKEVCKIFGCLSEDYNGIKVISKRAVFILNNNHKIEYAEVLDHPDSLPDFKAIQKFLSS